MQHKHYCKEKLLEGLLLPLSNGWKLKLGTILHQRDSMNGHHTLIIEAARDDVKSYEPPVVVKLSWMTSESHSGAGNQDFASTTRGSQAAANFPSLLYHGVVPSGAEILRRIVLEKVGNQSDSIKNHPLKFYVFRSLAALADSRDLTSFMSIYVDIVECHHWVYQVAKIVHGDINMNNMVYRRLRDGTTRGILIQNDVSNSTDDRRGALAKRISVVAQEVCIYSCVMDEFDF
ncbi:hypothetical protein ONZ45_g11402 [Pleurotus djamor]|nr:hypothetical protein ONZ45_g11402 [Pleurotus djamor]